MSQYGQRVGGARGWSGASVVSVGGSIEQSQVYNSSHPLYKTYTRQLKERIAEIGAKENEKAAKAQQAVCTVVLDVETKNEVTHEYPELRVVWPQWRAPVHSAWVARRELANQYMMHHVRTYATSIAHYGGSALAAMTFSDASVRLFTDTTSSVAVNEALEDDVNAAKLCASVASASSILDWHVPPDIVADYASGKILRKTAALSHSLAPADALIVDGTVTFMSPLQFAAAMLQHSAEVGVFAFPYHPSMLVHQSGEIYGTGVHYSLNDRTLRLMYPEAVAGVTAMDVDSWHGWLTNTTRFLPELDRVSFRYEMLGNRGPFMLVRVVRIDVSAPVGVELVHSHLESDFSEYDKSQAQFAQLLEQSVWTVSMGEDSLIVVKTVCAGEKAARTLAEELDLQAKFYETDAPHFASNFVLVDKAEQRVTLVPDPLKCVEKWSMAVAANDSKWEKPLLSAENSLRVCRDKFNLVDLPEGILGMD